MCNCCCCCQSVETPPTPPGDGGEPPVEFCNRYQVRIVSMNVSSIDDGFLGGDLEATFTFVVNGQARTWINNDLDTGVHNIGLTFFVDVPGPASTITLEVSGVEDDPISDDILAGFTRVHGQADNWGVGAQTGSASDSNITYTLNYEIVCARQVTVAVSRAALMSYAIGRVETRRKANAPNQTVLLAWGIDRLRREGWEVTASTSDLLFVKGSGSFPGLIERKYGGKQE